MYPRISPASSLLTGIALVVGATLVNSACGTRFTGCEAHLNCPLGGAGGLGGAGDTAGANETPESGSSSMGDGGDFSVDTESKGGTGGGSGAAQAGELDRGGTAGGVDGLSECAVGEKRACAPYPYAPALPDNAQCNDGKACTNPCKNGTQTCIASDATGAHWGDCVGAVGPLAADTCDPGDDSNCNGIANEGCGCISGTTQKCGTALGAKGKCGEGTTTCEDGRWGACTIQPAANDDCAVSGDDANCNGLTNDTCPCLPDETGTCAEKLQAKGVCASGRATCNANGDGWTCSTQPAAKDLCAGKDDNCNGTANDGCQCTDGQQETCAKALGAKGACAAGVTTCAGGKWGPCSIQPKTDTCDLDNDDSCDGNKHAPPGGCACISPAEQACGSCGDGHQECTASGTWGACQQPTQRTWYRDADGDGYGSSSNTSTCSTAPTGYVSKSGDCCDTDANAHPGQSAYFSSANKCGDWDYDCNGSTDKQPNQIGPSNCGTVTYSCIDTGEDCNVNCMSSCGSACTVYSQPDCGSLITYTGRTCTYMGNSCSGVATGNQTKTAQACR